MTVLHELVCDDGTVTAFAEFERQTRCGAAWLTARTAPGDRVAVVADNGAGHAALYYGVPRSGRVLTLINQRLAPAEQAAQLAATRPSVLFGDARYLSALPAATAQNVVTFGSVDWQAVVTSDPQFDVRWPRPCCTRCWVTCSAPAGRSRHCARWPTAPQLCRWICCAGPSTPSAWISTRAMA